MIAPRLALAGFDGPGRPLRPGAAGLTASVSSAEEEHVEGVVVRARK